MVLDKTRTDALARVEALIEAAHRVEMIGALGSRRDLVRAINDVATARESAATALAELRSE
jgi:hypothetical protein